MSSARRKPNFDQIPLLTPDSEWQPPEQLPDLRRVGTLALDIETRDPRLSRGGGAGWAYGDGEITGVAVAWAGGSIYVPLRHPDTPGCFQPAQVERWLRDTLTAGEVRVVTHGGAYDWGWLMHEFKLTWPDHIDDTIAMAMMVDENRLQYRLDAVCKWRGIPGKDEALLKDAAVSYGIPADKVKENLWRLPARYVGPYAEQDAIATLQLRDNLIAVMREEELLDAYATEMAIVPMVHAMRKRGIRVDLDAAQRAKAELEGKRDHAVQQICGLTDRRLSIADLRRAVVLEELHDAFDISYPRTAKTERGSFTDDWMSKHEHQLPQLISQAHKYDSAANKFVQGFILDFAHRGRMHATINQFRNEDGGTRSHRFSYSDPPLQQMPARDTEVMQMIRGCFLPEEGEQWLAADYSQQEYRLIVHYADLLNLRKADIAAEMYRRDTDTDFHQIVVEWTGLDRRSAKNTNFAKAYGAGVKKFATMLGHDYDSLEGLETAKAIYEIYATEFPFVDALARICQDKAEKRGYVKMFDGARNHFELWEPAAYRERDTFWAARPRDIAEKEWPNQRLRRANCHKAMNRLIQGSAARQVKIAMKLCFEAGHLPLLQMHDELDFSVPLEGFAVMDEIRDCMIKATAGMTIPMKVDLEYGPTWGETENKR